MTETSCPKEMRYGPCGGVRQAGECEVDARPCPFLDVAAMPPPAPPPHAALPLPTPVPTMIVDVRAPRHWTGEATALWQRTAERLQGCIALLGEHVDNPALHDDAGALRPHRVIEILAAAGVATIATVTGRDRDLAAARVTIREYRDAGALAIHCVTGDHPASLGIHRPAHFGTEAMELVAASVEEGIAATVGEAPASPGSRLHRLRAKESAGASLCILNHSGDTVDLIAFADACRALGIQIPLIAPVPMIGDKQAAVCLAGFPGLVLPHDFIADIIDAVDPAAQGCAAARRMAVALSASGRFAGINLSGPACGADPWERLEATATFLNHVRNAWSANFSEHDPR